MSVAELIEKGVNLFQNNELEHSKKALLEAYKLENDNLDVLNFLGLVNLHLHEYDEAISYFDKALEVEPKDKVVCNNKGDAYGMMEDYEKALECFNYALEIDEKYSSAHFNMGIIYGDMGEFEKAHKSFENAEKYTEDDDELLDIFYEHATLYLEEDDYKTALKYVQKYEDRKESAEIFNLKATCLDQTGKPEEALVYYERSETMAEDDELLADILFNKAFALIATDKKEEAANSLIKSAELYPDIEEEIIDNEVFDDLRNITSFKERFSE
jgi:tetratricopeptide (TPR) repeat protein